LQRLAKTHTAERRGQQQGLSLRQQASSPEPRQGSGIVFSPRDTFRTWLVGRHLPTINRSNVTILSHRMDYTRSSGYPEMAHALAAFVAGTTAPRWTANGSRGRHRQLVQWHRSWENRGNAGGGNRGGERVGGHGRCAAPAHGLRPSAAQRTPVRISGSGGSVISGTIGFGRARSGWAYSGPTGSAPKRT
jgi:hypothetical protein